MILFGNVPEYGWKYRLVTGRDAYGVTTTIYSEGKHRQTGVVSWVRVGANYPPDALKRCGFSDADIATLSEMGAFS
jgi:hypothetical protein